ncbi:BMP family ABC transporter substrate-binding protein [Nonomuraea sp. NPDC026600]|uniref:BMP family ABC transporter substrate-binding protein n=1 Tax=Nonomuraea sp. NPDC026600 TaxID=3155363 RepID=UPI0033F74DC5
MYHRNVLVMLSGHFLNRGICSAETTRDDRAEAQTVSEISPSPHRWEPVMSVKTGTKLGRHLLAVWALVSGLALAGCGTAGGGGAANAAGGGEAAGAGKTVALVTPQKAGDGGPTDNLIAGLDKLKAAGYSTRSIAATDPSSHESTLRNLARSGASVIVVAFSEFIQPLKTVAPEFPDTKFVHVYADAYKPTIPNVQTVTFDTQGPSYLAGVLAATVSKTGVIGFIGGTALPALYADFHAYQAGAKATRTDITVKSAFVGSFGDPVKGQQIAQTMFNNKVDVVLAYAGGSSLGVVKAADQAKTHVIYDNDESPETAGSVIAVASQHYGGTMARNVLTIDSGTWKPGETVAGLADGGTFLDPAKQLASTGETAAGVTKAFASVESVKQKIIQGTIDVPFNTDPV